MKLTQGILDAQEIGDAQPQQTLSRRDAHIRCVRDESPRPLSGELVRETNCVPAGIDRDGVMVAPEERARFDPLVKLPVGCR